MLSPRTPRRSTSTVLQVGDHVVLPEGQHGVLKYIGKIQGKQGEYAGIELVDGYESHGRHSGSFNNVMYFTTSKPSTGVFISYTKLIASTSRAKTSTTPATITNNHVTNSSSTMSKLQTARRSSLARLTGQTPPVSNLMKPPSTPLVENTPSRRLVKPAATNRNSQTTTGNPPRRSTLTNASSGGLFSPPTKNDEPQTSPRRPRQEVGSTNH